MTLQGTDAVFVGWCRGLHGVEGQTKMMPIFDTEIDGCDRGMFVDTVEHPSHAFIGVTDVGDVFDRYISAASTRQARSIETTSSAFSLFSQGSATSRRGCSGTADHLFGKMFITNDPTDSLFIGFLVFGWFVFATSRSCLLS